MGGQVWLTNHQNIELPHYIHNDCTPSCSSSSRPWQRWRRWKLTHSRQPWDFIRIRGYWDHSGYVSWWALQGKIYKFWTLGLWVSKCCFYLKAGRLLQSKVHIATEEAKQAKRDLADVTNTKGSSKRRKISSTVPDADTEEVSMVAKMFTIMNLFWLHDEQKTFRTRVDEQYDDLQRFENLENKIQGQISDILDVLPSRYADILYNNAWLSQTVSSVLLIFLCASTFSLTMS